MTDSGVSTYATGGRFQGGPLRGAKQIQRDVRKAARRGGYDSSPPRVRAFPAPGGPSYL